MPADRRRGQLSVADVRHVAEAHDFTWSDEQLQDMVGMFDADNDGLVRPVSVSFPHGHHTLAKSLESVVALSKANRS